MRRYWKAVLSEDNIAWNNQMEHAYMIRPQKIESGTDPYTYNELTYVKGPVYLDPVSDYMIEFTIKDYIQD